MVGVLGSLVLGEKKPRTPGYKNSKSVGEAPPAGFFEWGERMGFRLGFFCVFFSECCQNYPPPFCKCWKPVFIGKNVAKFFNLVPQLLSFCKF